MGFFFAYLLAVPTAFGILAGGVWAWTGLFMIFGVNIALDEWIRDRQISSGFWRKLLFHHGAAEVALLFSFPFLVGFLAVALRQVVGFETWWEILGSVISIGIVLGLLGINTAHELVHRRSAWARAVGVMNLSMSNFAWYRITHLDVHHRYVGTDRDPATARADEKVWTYWWRSLFGNLREVAKLEFEKQGWGVGNRLFHYVGILASIGGLLWLWVGTPIVIAYWLVAALTGVLMLQTVEYIEHKGLVRAMSAEGRPEPVRAWHSWDCYYLITNLSLFNLGYHSNHHLKAALEFPSLGPVENAKVMPHGYALMVVRAIVGLS
jgi:alkane 1-monooxygenase